MARDADDAIVTFDWQTPPQADGVNNPEHWSKGAPSARNHFILYEDASECARLGNGIAAPEMGDKLLATEDCVWL